MDKVIFSKEDVWKWKLFRQALSSPKKNPLVSTQKNSKALEIDGKHTPSNFSRKIIFKDDHLLILQTHHLISGKKRTVGTNIAHVILKGF